LALAEKLSRKEQADYETGNGNGFGHHGLCTSLIKK